MLNDCFALTSVLMELDFSSQAMRSILYEKENICTDNLFDDLINKEGIIACQQITVPGVLYLQPLRFVDYAS